jgi:hypothetical protein
MGWDVPYTPEGIEHCRRTDNIRFGVTSRLVKRLCRAGFGSEMNDGVWALGSQ